MTPWAEKMNERQAAGLCRVCGKPQVPGRTMCETHLAEQRARRNERYAARKATGLCVGPGCRRRAAGGHDRCKACHRSYTLYNRLWKRESRKKAKQSTS